VIEEVAEGRMGEREQGLRDVLATMLFRGDDVYKPLGLLSGGERARVRLAQLLLDKPNVLVLDEPTNHLDIPSREALEGALAGFDGTILCVSHDRYFLDRSIGRLLVLHPPDMTDFGGTYSGWMRKLAEDAAAESERKAAASQSKPKEPASAARPKDSAKKKDNPYARPYGRLTVEELERQITDTEIALSECQQGFGDSDSFKDPSRSQQLQAEYKTLSAKLEALEAEYFAREQ
jgi:ATP-binding cassette subfamily F protein 3